MTILRLSKIAIVVSALMGGLMSTAVSAAAACPLGVSAENGGSIVSAPKQSRDNCWEEAFDGAAMEELLKQLRDRAKYLV